DPGIPSGCMCSGTSLLYDVSAKAFEPPAKPMPPRRRVPRPVVGGFLILIIQQQGLRKPFASLRLRTIGDCKTRNLERPITSPAGRAPTPRLRGRCRRRQRIMRDNFRVRPDKSHDDFGCEITPALALGVFSVFKNWRTTTYQRPACAPPSTCGISPVTKAAASR